MIPNKFLRNRSGIYGIRNLTNNKIYVGKTKCMYRRCRQYAYDFKNRSIGHINNYLYNAMQKVGIENFELFPLEFCDLNIINSKELDWIIQLRSTNKKYGYNLRLDSSTGMITNESTSKKISRNLRAQWASGIRDKHSKKLKKKWSENPKRRKEQSMLLSRIKTKYIYQITSPDGVSEFCKFNKLVDLKLKNVLTEFHRKKTNDVTHKGYRIRRYPHEG